ncbi:hypothetical protein ACQKKX_02530 [Neorhizobium sp. NPDC001467]|uniref:hypothetical protein n=1 Tax=Neorhizobium sp. NPDC001467 TaxID=3390595 RepID=UPI003CFE21CF
MDGVLLRPAETRPPRRYFACAAKLQDAATGKSSFTRAASMTTARSALPTSEDERGFRHPHDFSPAAVAIGIEAFAELG